MSKFNLIGLKNEEKDILKALTFCRCCEVVGTKEVEGTHFDTNTTEREIVANKLSKLQNCISFLAEQKAEHIKFLKEENKKFEEKKPFFAYRNEIKFDDFANIVQKESEIFDIIAQIDELENLVSNIKSENARLNNLIEQLSIYLPLQEKFSEFSNSKNCIIQIGTVPNSQKNEVEELQSEFERISCRQISVSSSAKLLFVAYLKSDESEISKKLTELSFVKCSFNFDCTASQKTEECKREIAKNEIEKKEIASKCIEFLKNIKEIQILFDYYDLELKKIDFDANFAKTEKTFSLSAFVPKEEEELVKNQVLSETQNVVMEFCKPADDEEIPTATKNKRLVEPFEQVTNMYSVPNARENDPNPFVMIFFFIFFGIMLSDAGYGIILALLSVLVLKFFKVEKGMKRLVAIIGLGGISTLIWGALFGSWFGIEGIKPLMFNPMEEPVSMLLLCLALGLIQILFGMGLKAREYFQAKKPWDAIFDVGSWYLFFIGLLVFAVETLLKTGTSVGLIIFISSIVLLVATQGRKEKGIFKKLFKGVASLYGIVGFLSDILSYARLFGLGLATGVIALVFNTLAGMMFGNPFTFIFGIAILLIGHTFNIGINVLGAYVHNCRLQYIEFFSRFYYGGGREFAPLGENLKFNIIV